METKNFESSMKEFFLAWLKIHIKVCNFKMFCIEQVSLTLKWILIQADAKNGGHLAATASFWKSVSRLIGYWGCRGLFVEHL